MGIFDQAKDLSRGHEAETDQGIEKVGDAVDQRTGGKFAGQVDQAQQAADAQLGDEAGGAPAEPPQQ